MSNGLNGNENSATTFNVLPNSASTNSTRVTGMNSSNITPSKWGIKGTEDMGGGIKTSFVLESALNINAGVNPNGRLNDATVGTSNGNQGVFNNGEGSIQGQMFDREATIGVEGPFGMIKAGRMVTVMADTIGAYDPMSTGYAVSPLGFNGGYSGAGFTGESRWDNSLKYTKSFGPVNFAAGYKTAGTTGGLQQGQAYGATLEYVQPTWSVKAGYEANSDAILAGLGFNGSSPNYTSVPGTLALTFADTNAFTLAGKYIVGAFTFKGGWEIITTTNPGNAAYDTVANYGSINGIPVNNVSVTGFNNARTQNMYWLGVNYQATSKVELSGAAYQLNTGTYGSTGGFTMINGNSQQNVFSVKATYALSPRTKLYVTDMQAYMSGPAWESSGSTSGGSNGLAGAGAAIANMNTVTAGIVHTF